jgi:ATP-dependent DNA helicase RecG
MSATPIPRTLALVVYGNLEISTINNRPKDNNIKTNIVIQSKQNDMWNYIKAKLSTGSKAYVVCSRIDEENDDDDMLKFSAKNMYDYLCTIFDKNEVALIHGKLSKETQNKTIEKFRNGTIKVLVSTTIVEVGVDVPDADIMVVATPDRFGLATLHQLRGRIGRNGAEAHCFCLADGLNEKSYNRIKYFKDNLNGFDIADFDLKTRGAGSIIGTNQSGKDGGLLANFTIESFKLASEILEQVKPNVPLYTQILGVGEQIVNSNSYSKIVLN